MIEDGSARPRALAIVGPTASGKARLGLQVAERFRLPILVCDSVKVYRKLDIGTAKPSAQARARVPHHLIDLVDPDEPFSAGQYARHALEHLQCGPGLFVGGTGFYLRAVAWTFSGQPEVERASAERQAFEDRWLAAEAEHAGAIHRALFAIDPETAREIHPNNVVRGLRALWLCNLHGQPISRVRRRNPPSQRVDLLAVLHDPGPAAVDAAIEARVDRMLAAGWLAEVEKLWEAGYDARHRAMSSLGYRQLLDVVEGRMSLDVARNAIVTATRQFSRRQRTYLRGHLHVPTVHVADSTQVPWDELAAFISGGSP